MSLPKKYLQSLKPAPCMTSRFRIPVKRFKRVIWVRRRKATECENQMSSSKFWSQSSNETQSGTSATKCESATWSAWLTFRSVSGCGTSASATESIPSVGRNDSLNKFYFKLIKVHWSGYVFTLFLLVWRFLANARLRWSNSLAYRADCNFRSCNSFVFFSSSFLFLISGRFS